MVRGRQEPQLTRHRIDREQRPHRLTDDLVAHRLAGIVSLDCRSDVQTGISPVFIDCHIGKVIPCQRRVIPVPHRNGDLARALPAGIRALTGHHVPRLDGEADLLNRLIVRRPMKADHPEPAHRHIVMRHAAGQAVLDLRVRLARRYRQLRTAAHSGTSQIRTGLRHRQTGQRVNANILIREILNPKLERFGDRRLRRCRITFSLWHRLHLDLNQEMRVGFTIADAFRFKIK